MKNAAVAKVFQDIAGIGEAISTKIESLLTTGRLEFYDKLRAEFPEGIFSLMDVPGIGPKTAMRLVEELGISNVEDMEKAIGEGKVAALSRLGEKTTISRFGSEQYGRD